MARKPRTVAEAEQRLFDEEAKLKGAFARRGDEIAKAKGYSSLSGLDAVYRYLIDKYHWLPSEVRSLSVDDLCLLLDDNTRKG